jgi:hypothetical protein
VQGNIQSGNMRQAAGTPKMLAKILRAYIVDEKGKNAQAKYKISPKDTVPKALGSLE